MKTDTNTPRDSWASFDDLCKHYGGISRSTVERFVASGVLPPPTAFGSKLNRWRWSDIEIADTQLLSSNQFYRTWRDAADAAAEAAAAIN